MCADQQFGTNFRMICEAQTLGNSINVGLTAGHFSVRIEQEARLIDVD